jgi:hypothetical protein
MCLLLEERFTSGSHERIIFFFRGFVVSDESIICVCECVLVPGSGSKSRIRIIFKTTYTSDLSPHTLVSNFRDSSGHTDKTTPKNATDCDTTAVGGAPE